MRSVGHGRDHGRFRPAPLAAPDDSGPDALIVIEKAPSTRLTPASDDGTRPEGRSLEYGLLDLVETEAAPVTTLR